MNIKFNPGLSKEQEDEMFLNDAALINNLQQVFGKIYTFSTLYEAFYVKQINSTNFYNCKRYNDKTIHYFNSLKSSSGKKYYYEIKM